jgi:hypothetical protein
VAPADAGTLAGKADVLELLGESEHPETALISLSLVLMVSRRG